MTGAMKSTPSLWGKVIPALAYALLVVAFVIGQIAAQTDYEALLQKQMPEVKLTRSQVHKELPVVYRMAKEGEELPDVVVMADGEGYGGPLVVGVKARRTEEGTVKFLRKPAKWFIRKLASYLTGVKIPDLNSGLRVMRADVARQFVHLLPRGFSCVTTITMAFLSNGYSVKYVPIDYAKRAGESKFHWWADTRRYLLQVVRMVLSWNPLKVLMPPAVVLGLIAAAKVVYDIVDKSWRLGTNTIVILGAAFSLALLGMVADLMVHLSRQRYNVIPATRHPRIDPL